MLDQMQKTINRNMLKYAAGHAIFCPSCGNILDYRASVLWESPSGKNGISCADCWRKGFEKIHDDNPHEYLISIGWQVNTLVNFSNKTKPAKPAYPQKPGKALNTFLRKDIFKGMKRAGYVAKTDRAFPAQIYGTPCELIDTLTPDGFDSSYATVPDSSPARTADYVRKYCELNHLTM